MAFDPTGAVPIKSTKPFDPTGAQPVGTKVAKPDPVDFETGLTFTDRMALAQADNPAEQETYLRSVYGNSVGKEKDGTLTVNVKGKKIAASGGGFVSGLAADVLGNSPTLAGATYGAIEGATIGTVGGPWGIGIGALGGAALGAMTGKSIIEGEKVLGGRYRKDLKQYGDVMLDTGKGGIEGEAGGQVVAKVGGKIVKGMLPKWLTQMNQEDVQMTDRMLEGGARPNAQGTMPGMKRIQFMETLARKVVGGVKGQDEANAGYIRKRMGKMLYDAGHSPAEVEATLSAMSDNSALIPTAQVGEDVRKAVQAHQGMLEKNVEERVTQVDQEVTKRVSRLDKILGSMDPEGLAVDGSRAIQSARRDFGTAMSKVFEKVDSMVGDRKLVPIKLFASEASKISRRLFQSQTNSMVREGAALGKEPKSAFKPEDMELFKSLGIKPPEVDPHGMISFGDAQRMRSLLLEKAGTSPVKGIQQGELSHLASMLDYGIDAAAQNPVAKPAVSMLRKVNGLYKKGMRKFEDSTVKYLHGLADHGIPPDPEAIAAKILKSGNTERIATIKQLIGPENWKKVVGADYKNLMSDSLDEFGNVDGPRLLRELNARGPSLDTVYGKFAKELKELAHVMAARDGRLPVDELSPSNAKLTLENLKKEQKALDDYMKKNAVSDLANEKGNPERIHEWLAHPDHSTELAKTIKLLGNGHPALEGVRKAALKEVLTQTKMAVAETGRPSDALSKAINKFSPQQQEQLFPGGLADDIKLLGKETERLMTDLNDSAKSSFAAGAVLALPLPLRVGPQVGIAAYQIILSQPKVIRYLALGLRSKHTFVRDKTKTIIRTMIRYGYLPSGQAEEPEHSDENADN